MPVEGKRIECNIDPSEQVQVCPAWPLVAKLDTLRVDVARWAKVSKRFCTDPPPRARIRSRERSTRSSSSSQVSMTGPATLAKLLNEPKVMCPDSSAGKGATLGQSSLGR